MQGKEGVRASNGCACWYWLGGGAHACVLTVEGGSLQSMLTIIVSIPGINLGTCHCSLRHSRHQYQHVVDGRPVHPTGGQQGSLLHAGAIKHMSLLHYAACILSVTDQCCAWFAARACRLAW